MLKRLAGFEISAEVGRGAMATVYRARSITSQAGMPDDVAIKVLRSEYLTDLGFRARFEREGQMITALQHPAIVPVYEFGQQGEQLYIVMAYMPRGSLAERLLFQNSTLGTGNGEDSAVWAWSIEVLERVAEALDYAHSRGIVHRDLKPSNVLFDSADVAFLGDFGIAWHPKLHSQHAGMVTGTPAYMSPEQAGAASRAGAAEQIGPATDIYALGVMAYQMLAGQLPFRAESAVAVLVQHAHEAPLSPRAANPALSEGAEQVLLKALAKEPERRFDSALEMVNALRRALDDGDWRLEIGDWEVGTGALETGGLEIGGLVRDRSRDSVDSTEGVADMRGLADRVAGIRRRAERRWEASVSWLSARPALAFGLVTVTAIICAFGTVMLLRGPAMATAVRESDGVESGMGAGAGDSPQTALFLPLTQLDPVQLMPTTESATAAPTTAMPPAAGPAPTPEANVSLLYDTGKVALLNVSGAHVSLNEVALRRVTEDGSTSPTLQVSMLGRVAADAVGALPPGDCLQLLGVEAIQNRRAGKPAQCDRLRGWLATRQTHLLFEGAIEGDTFEVLLDEQVIQRCPLTQDSCQFFVPQE